ncbi:hypothetical protein P7K49_002510 [Saguinus oedipus]|uniref:RNA polymerase Rpb7-like N-terminal domain-containing protein n=1 Tax=Saguinus oedipus TaxID=9490 RepID=A0ABQ9WHJ6_SAGOE|nr:hypothetical protein P7K49_002510 [Saguinus oedipus]
MFVLVEMVDTVRIPPWQFERKLNDSIAEELNKKLANKVLGPRLAGRPWGGRASTAHWPRAWPRSCQVLAVGRQLNVSELFFTVKRDVEGDQKKMGLKKGVVTGSDVRIEVLVASLGHRRPGRWCCSCLICEVPSTRPWTILLQLWLLLNQAVLAPLATMASPRPSVSGQCHAGAV